MQSPAPVYVILLILILIGCGKSLPTLDGINLTDWKTDKNGCQGIRLTMAGNMIAQKEKLLALSETQIINLLGKPDENELYKRNEKFYRYYFSNGPECSADGRSQSMNLRFNAVGMMKEVVVE
jgi:hypothetical protein